MTSLSSYDDKTIVQCLKIIIMANYLELNGSKVFPRGNTQIIQSDNEIIDVSELIETTDGIIIETNGENKFDLFIEPVEVDENLVFGTTLNILDKYKRLKTVAQWSYYTNLELASGILSVNSLLEGNEILVQAFKDGEEVHNYTIENNPESLDQNWLPVAILIVAAASVILSNVDYEKETTVTTNPDWSKTTTVRTKKSFGGGGTISASSSVVEQPTNGIEFDHLFITSSHSYNTEYYDELDGPISEVILVGILKI